MPAPAGAVWAPGTWVRRDRKFKWVGGCWARPPRPGARWTPPRWQKKRTVIWALIPVPTTMYRFTPGKWQ